MQKMMHSWFWKTINSEYALGTRHKLMMKSIGLSLRLTEDRDDGVHLEAALLASAAAAAAFGSSGLYDKFGYIQCIFVTL